ncbi:MAG: hypothetical protein HY579_02815 [Nitrospinae bacterium]|nr:hypothetical protein [Nitrospinota bacterium]
MNLKNIEDIDDEELLCLYESTKKLLESSMNQGNNPSSKKKVPILKQKIETIEQELKARSLWEGD